MNPARPLALPLLALVPLGSALSAQCDAGKPAPTGLGANDLFGKAVALSGTTLLVGTHQDDDRGSNAGAAYSFEQDGPNWFDETKLVASDGGANDRFGISVDVDGDVAVVGADFEDAKGSNAGAAYVFERTVGVWAEAAKLVASDGAANDQLGFVVAVAGTTVALGAYNEDDQGLNAGAVYVFEKLGGSWVETAKLVAPDGAGSDQFGVAVALAGDVLAVGANQDDDQGSNSGSAYVFERQGGVWSWTAKLTAGDGAPNDRFGSSVGVGNDVVVVGSFQDDDGGSNAGSVYTFGRSGSTWTETAKLTASDRAANDSFGFSVDVAPAGDAFVVGAYQDDDKGSNSGSAYAFTLVGASWVESGKLVARDGSATDNLGYAVALDGDLAVAGAYLDDPSGSSSGSVTSFSLSGATCATFTATPGQLRVSSGGTQALAIDADPTFQGNLYWVLGSASGASPGFTVGSLRFPLNLDPYLWMTALVPNQGPLALTVGMLDENGDGDGAIQLAPGTSPALAGLTLHHAALMLDGYTGRLLSISNATSLRLNP